MDTKVNSLPPIGALFKDSWSTFTQSILPLFLLNILGIVIYIVLAIIAFLIFILSGAGSFLLKNGLENISATLSSITPSLVITAAVITVIFSIIFILVNSALQIASVFIIDNPGKKSVSDSFKKSFGLIIPLFLVGIITFILEVGSFFVFILPAILIGILLIFVQFEVILNNQRWMEAIKRSNLLVSKHFGGILGRAVLLFLIYVGISLVGNVIGSISQETKTLVNFLSFFINILLGWFSLAYFITLYKQVNAGHEREPGKSITWMWIVSILGWLIAIALGFVTYKTISSGILNKLLETPSTAPYTQNNATPSGQLDFNSQTN